VQVKSHYGICRLWEYVLLRSGPQTRICTRALSDYAQGIGCAIVCMSAALSGCSVRGQGHAQAVVADRELTVTGAGGLRPIPGRGSVGCGTLQRVLCIAPGMLDRMRVYTVLN